MRRAWLQGAFGVVVFAGSVAACEDPPPPVQQGAFFVQFTDSGIDCNVKNHQEVLGTVGETDKPELVSDGASNAGVLCTVKKAGSVFVVSTELDGAATVQIDIPSLSDQQATQAMAAKGQIKYASSETGGKAYSSPQGGECDFWVDTTKGQYLKPGEAWFSFDCASVVSGDQNCSVKGYVALKNCTGIPTEEDEE